MTTVRFFMPIRASLLAAVLTEVLHGPLMHFWGGLSASEVLINRADEVVADLLWHNFAGSPY